MIDEEREIPKVEFNSRKKSLMFAYLIDESRFINRVDDVA